MICPPCCRQPPACQRAGFPAAPGSAAATDAESGLAPLAGPEQQRHTLCQLQPWSHFLSVCFSDVFFVKSSQTAPPAAAPGCTDCSRPAGRPTRSARQLLLCCRRRRLRPAAQRPRRRCGLRRSLGFRNWFYNAAVHLPLGLRRARPPCLYAARLSSPRQGMLLSTG